MSALPDWTPAKQQWHDLDPPDEPEDDLQQALQRARRLVDLLDGDRLTRRYDRFEHLIAEARADLTQAAEIAQLRWMAQD